MYNCPFFFLNLVPLYVADQLIDRKCVNAIDHEDGGITLLGVCAILGKFEILCGNHSLMRIILFFTD